MSHAGGTKDPPPIIIIPPVYGHLQSGSFAAGDERVIPACSAHLTRERGQAGNPESLIEPELSISLCVITNHLGRYLAVDDSSRSPFYVEWLRKNLLLLSITNDENFLIFGDE